MQRSLQDALPRKAVTMNFTKKAIISTFKELLNEQPLNKITVREIVERCGINRNTFYYHFDDVPALLEEVIKNIADEIIQTYSKFGSPMDCLTPVVEYCQTHRTAILHIYRSVQNDNFLVQLDRISLYIVKKYVDTTMSELFDPSAPSKERDILIRYYKCTMVGVLLDWLGNGMKYDLMAGAASICKLFDGSGRQAFLKCIDSQT